MVMAEKDMENAGEWVGKAEQTTETNINKKQENQRRKGIITRRRRRRRRRRSTDFIWRDGAGIAQLVVFGLAVHSVAGSILLWGHFPVEGIFPLELTWVQTPFPKKLFRMRV